MRLLVTGSGRCGTGWIAKSLTSAGTVCGHEAVFNQDRHGEGDWSAEASWLAAPFTPFPYTYTVHLVRDPLATIRSLASPTRAAPGGTLGDPPNGFGYWVYSYLPELEHWPDVIERCAAFWVSWNRSVHADERIRLEDITPAEIGRLARIANPDAPGIRRLPAPTNRRRRKVPPLAWTDVAHIPGLLDLAHEYGYR